MNERIKELFQKSGGHVEVCDVTKDEILTYSENLDPEKFAKLIIRECVFQCDDFTSQEHILEYFGIEQ